jgi:hypothetical protein
MSKLTSRRTWGVAVAVAVSLAFAGGVAGAVAGSGTVKTYTGCLTTNGGTMSAIAEGNAPLKPCSPGSTQARFSAGDITSIAVGPGLVLPDGGDNGDVTINLDTKYSLPQGCGFLQVAKWNGSGWECRDDNDTTYTNGTGLTLTGTTFSISPEYQVKNGQSCTDGKFANGIGSTGSLSCASLPPPPSTHTYIRHLDSAPVFKGIFETAATLALPAGKYVVNVSAIARDDSDEDVTVECRLQQGGTDLGSSEVQVDEVSTAGKPDIAGEGSIAITAAPTLAADGSLVLSCASVRGNDSLRDVSITATKVDEISTQ